MFNKPKVNHLVKRMCNIILKNYMILTKANVLEPNNAFTLQSRGHFKRMLNEYQRALEDLNKTDVFEPNNASKEAKAKKPRASKKAAKALVEPIAQHEPQYCGICWFRVGLQ
jgi:tetratricopeptide (TPR) repeat protein